MRNYKGCQEEATYSRSIFTVITSNNILGIQSPSDRLVTIADAKQGDFSLLKVGRVGIWKLVRQPPHYQS